jgi:hypothetical protein
VFGLPADRVWVSVYEEDEEALAIWRDLVGVPPERIKKMGAADNFWASGPTGELLRQPHVVISISASYKVNNASPRLFPTILDIIPVMVHHASFHKY